MIRVTPRVAAPGLCTRAKELHHDLLASAEHFHIETSFLPKNNLFTVSLTVTWKTDSVYRNFCWGGNASSYQSKLLLHFVNTGPTDCHGLDLERTYLEYCGSLKIRYQMALSFVTLQ
jgi:hypothetical protein